MSEALLELENLFGLVSCHLRRCDDQASLPHVLRVLRQTAMRLANTVEPHERRAAHEIVAEWPTTT